LVDLWNAFKGFFAFLQRLNVGFWKRLKADDKESVGEAGFEGFDKERVGVVEEVEWTGIENSGLWGRELNF